MGLHVDIDRVAFDNSKKSGLRKLGNVLINTDDNLTKEAKLQLIRENKVKYGLPQEYIDSIKLPTPSDVQVYDLFHIIKGKLTYSEKIEHMMTLKIQLLERLNTVN